MTAAQIRLSEEVLDDLARVLAAVAERLRDEEAGRGRRRTERGEVTVPGASP
jgi:hypothetical protein